MSVHVDIVGPASVGNVSQGLAPSDASPGGQRIDYVDVARGMLILLMFAVHAATPCASLIRERIQGLWILEIATTGFAMMAGYTVALRYESRACNAPTRRLWKRCGELLVVMFWSNLVLSGAKLYAEHRLGFDMFPRWFLGLFTFHTEYNISGVLLSLALLLPVLSIILWLEGRVGGWTVWGVFAVLLSSTVVLKATEAGPPAFDHLKTILLVGPGGFAVLEFVGYGLLGFASARMAQNCRNVEWPFRYVVAAGFGITAVSYVVMNAALATIGPQSLAAVIWGALNPFVRAMGMFLGVLVLAGAYLKGIQRLGDFEFISLLGRYSLFAFVFHRFVAQAMITAFGLQGGGLPTFLLVFSLITVLTYLVCRLRSHNILLNRLLVRCYL